MAGTFLSTVSSLCSRADQRVLTRFILVFLLVIAIGYPLIIDDVFAIKLPQFHGALPPMSPWWGLCLLLILILGFQLHGMRALQEALGRIDTIFWILISYLCVRDAAAYTVSGQIDSEFAWTFFWIYAVFLCLRLHAKPHDIDFIILFSALTAIAIVGGSLLAPANILENFTIEYIFSAMRPNWSFTNALSYCAATAAIISLHLLLRERLTTGRRIILALALFINLVGIFLNKSRTAWLCAILGLGIVLMVRLLKGRSLPAIAAILGLCMAVLLGVTVRYWEHVELLISLGRGITPETEMALRGQLGSEETSINVRVAMIEHAMALFKEKPFFGHGLVMTRAENSSGYALHGIPLIFLASYGLIGTGLLALLAAAVFPRRGWLGSWSVTIAMLVPLGAALIMMSVVHLWYVLPLLFLHHAQMPDGPARHD